MIKKKIHIFKRLSNYEKLNIHKHIVKEESKERKRSTRLPISHICQNIDHVLLGPFKCKTAIDNFNNLIFLMNCAEMKFKTIYRSWTFALFIYQTTVKVINSVLRDRAGRRKSRVTWLSNWGTRLVFICPHGESLDTRRTPVTHSKEKNNNRRRTKDRKRREKYIITSDWNRIHKEMSQPEQRNGNLDASTLSETWHLK